MFRKLIDKLKSLSTGGQEPFDPTTLNDPVAMETDWSPLKGGGANFCTRKLVQVSPLRYEFRASTGAKVFYLLFFFIGLGVSVVAISLFVKNGVFLSPEVLIPGGIGLVFTLVGGVMFYFGTKPVVFDK